MSWDEKYTSNGNIWVIKYDPPPIPARNCDWCAVLDDSDGFAMYARTKDLLIWQIEEWKDCK